jgi:uncharacterized protein with gpF-like domain
MFRAQADRVERKLERFNWTLPAAVQGRQEEEDEQEAELVLTAAALVDLSTLKEEIRGVFSGLPEEEIARLADELGVDEEDLRAYLQTNNLENLIEAGYQASLERLDADTNFDPSDPDVQAIQSRLNQQARGIAQTTQREINEAIRQGIAENESVSEVQDRVTSTLRRMAEGDDDPDTEIDQSRARRIASTTTTTAFEKGQEKAMQDNGMFGRMWLSQRDVHVRSGHLEADGQTVRLDEPFRVGSIAGGSEEELQFPGDPTGSPANVINCRCTALPIPDRETFTEMQSEEPDLSNLPQLNG